MNRGAPITPKGKNESEPSQTKSSSQSALDSFLAKARNIRDWEENTATENLYTFGKKNGVFKNDENHLIWHLIEKQTGIWKKSDDSRSQDAFGRNLLSWMLRTPDLLEIFTTSFKTERRGKNDYSKRMPLHFAIDKCNLGFIACFIDIYATSIKTGGKAWGSLKNASIIFTQREELNKQNLLQYAAEKRCLLTSALVKICPPAALIDSDENGYTAFHTALAWPPGATQDITTRGWDIPSFFHSKDVFNAVIDRYDANDILCEILPKTNNEGSSVFQEAPVDHVDIPKLQELIFEKLKDISKVSTALYGTGKGKSCIAAMPLFTNLSTAAKELCLDMSDFNSPSHNFEKFVDRLIELNPLKASGSSEGDQSPEDSSSLVFETSLLFVHLPDLNYIKQPCSPEVFRKFFQWLSRQVENIRELKILDSTTSPLSDWFFCKFVSTKFHISKLDWRKLDIDLTILAETGDYLEELTLYSSGNWGVLYHWTSLDGLAQYPKVSSLFIPFGLSDN
ncbi:uncharacterized protein N7484_001074 [Penicillium longicatenatum]|uniref:uncharacterized protein n=1 Tax=Penicillium longicatenatum TaxID=1561947 RepID=UPI00254999D8|nr:uncharacterized protein N7484_001074 [Penicillium longicatenatum]KAJ5657425.1 hypothetical protein N7484_001074 [Penicillium longicatenatum]